MARLQSLLAGLLVMLLAPAQALADPKAVVELFTSQGCSSCVPADAYFAELARRDDVLALALHVDYWDYLGWRDTFGQPENTERQRAYSEVRGSRKIFTPQMTVNGRTDLVGSDRNAVEAATARASLPLPVAMHRRARTGEIAVAAQPPPRRCPTTARPGPR